MSKRLSETTIERILAAVSESHCIPVEALRADHVDLRQAEKAAVVALYDAGASWSHIAEILGYGGHQTPMRIYRRANTQSRRRPNWT